MAKQIGRNINKSDSSEENTIALTTTTIEIAGANTDRIRFEVHNLSKEVVFLNERGAVDNLTNGKRIGPFGSYDMAVDTPHTGKYSARTEKRTGNINVIDV